MTAMAEFIEKEVLLQKLSRMIDYCKNDKKVNGLTALFQVGDAVMDSPAADVAPIKHGRCPVCSGKYVISQDSDNGYTCEVWEREMQIWNGDECVAVFPIEYCPNCGAKMDGGDDNTEAHWTHSDAF